jgi:hypothetical protein
MRLRIYWSLTVFFICFQIYTQSYSGVKAPFINKSFDAFKTGESLKFRIHYGFFNASHATLKLEEDVVEGKKVFKATAIGRTTGIARFFFKVEDIYETFFDKNLVQPIKSTRDIYEGGYTKNVEIKYDYSNNLANVNDIKNSRLSSVKIEKNVQDLISTFYYLRNHFDVKKLKKMILFGLIFFLMQKTIPLE